MNPRPLALALLLLPTIAPPALHAAPRGFEARDLATLDRVSSPTLSPDGRKLVFARRVVDFDANKSSTSLWIEDLFARDAAPPKRLTPEGWNVNSPSFSPDGKTVYFLSAKLGTQQLWSIPSSGGPMTQVTMVATDIGSYKLSPDGKRIAFSAEAFVDCGSDLACSQKRIDAKDKQKNSGVVFDRMFIRHWDAWNDGRLNRVFVAALPAGAKPIAKATLVGGDVHGDVPSKPFGDESEYAWSPDGGSLVLAARKADREEPWSTNFDLYLVNADGSGTARNLTVANQAWDTGPAFSDDGKTLYYRAMKRPGFEADRFALMAMDLASGATREIAPRWDASADGITLSADGTAIYTTAQELGRHPLFKVSIENGEVSPVVGDGTISAFDLAGPTLAFARNTLQTGDQIHTTSADGTAIYTTAQELGQHPLFKVSIENGEVSPVVGDGTISAFDLAGPTLAFARNTLQTGDQIHTTSPDGGAPLRAITPSAGEMLEDVAFGDFEQFTFIGWNKETVHGYVVKPWNYEEGKQYPVAFLIHGGPQGSFGNGWSYRWNPQTYAGQGYAVVMIDFHGSTGYGQAFTDSISQHWGDRPLEDLQKGWAAAQQKYAFLDGDKACALGASYGGFMVNWIAGNWFDRNGNSPWKCLVNHDGVFDQRAMGYATEELWFTEWEQGGTTYDVPKNYEKFNPVNHVDKWKVPMLVVHGQRDYRIPVEQGIAAFTALQRRGIESKFLYFPDENHWVLKPQNSVQWHDTVNGWLKQYIGQ